MHVHNHSSRAANVLRAAKKEAFSVCVASKANLTQAHTQRTISIMFSPNRFYMNSVSLLRFLFLSQSPVVIVNCSIRILNDLQFQTGPHRKIETTNKTSCDRSMCYITSQNQLLSFFCFLCHFGGDGWSHCVCVTNLRYSCWSIGVDFIIRTTPFQSSQVIAIRVVTVSSKSD